ncbi:MAG: hypothetical protein IJV71_01640 [Lachnospiraceae bacterium]|nr:hypothetical protein [Lachnospiraceae bacterium]
MPYEEYLNKSNDTLTLEDANRILSSIQSSIDATDEDAVELYNDFLEGAFAYATVRSGWLLLSKEQKMDQDKGRTLKHDSVINRVNILARYLRNTGKKVSWREELGDSRKRIGDFACYVALFYGLAAR